MTRALARRGVAGWRAAALAGTLLALLAGYLTATVISASAADPLLSQGRPATASSTESAGTPASAAVDGNPGTRWSSAFSDPQWIRVDLGSTATISRVVLTWEGAYARAFTIQTSADGTTWTTVHTTTAGTGGTQDLAVTGTGRYVRLHATARATGWGVSLWEFQVYGTTGSGGCGTANAAQGRPATASSVRVGRVPGHRRGRRQHRHPLVQRRSADPQWLQVDLGAIAGDLRRHPELGGRLRDGLPDPDLHQRHHLDHRPHHDRPAPAARRTLSVTGTGRYVRMLRHPAGHRRTATRCGSSRCTPAARRPSRRRARPRARPPARHRAARGAAVVRQAGVRLEQPERRHLLRRARRHKAFDNDPASRWATSATDRLGRPRLDLRRPRRHRARSRQVVLQWDPAYATAYQIQVSANASTWTTIYSTTTGRGFKETLDRHRHRPLRADVRHRARSARTATRCGSSRSTAPAATRPPRRRCRPTRRSRPPAWSSATSSTAPPAASPTRRSGRSTPAPARTTRCSTTRTTTTPTWTAPAPWSSRPAGRPPAGREYTSHRMNTGNKFTVQYGRIEARVKVPEGQRPLAGVLDDGRRLPHRPPVAVQRRDRHHGGPRPQHPRGLLHAARPGLQRRRRVRPALHRARRRRPRERLPRLGGRVGQPRHHVPVRRQVGLLASKETVEATRGPWVFDHPFYLILNLAVGGDFPGPVDATTPFPPGCSSTTSASTSEETIPCIGPNPAGAQRLSTAALLALVGGYRRQPPPVANAADPLISQGRPATASSTENGGTPGRQRRRRQQRHPLVERVRDPQWLRVDLGATATVSRGRPALGRRVRARLHDPDLGQRHRPGPPSTPPPTAPAASRTSRSPAAAATCACTPPPAPPSGASRSGSSRCTAVGGTRAAATADRADRPGRRVPRRLPVQRTGCRTTRSSSRACPAPRTCTASWAAASTNAYTDVSDLLTGATQLQPGDRHVVVLGADVLRRQPARSSRSPASSTTWARASATTSREQTQPLPLGLRIVAGNARATGAGRHHDLALVVPAPQRGGRVARTSSPARPARMLESYLDFPQCWNGRDLDSADHKSHMAYPVNNACPSTHPVHVPKLRQVLRYPVSGNPARFRLASGRRVHDARRLLQRLARGGDGAPGARLHPTEDQVRRQRHARDRCPSARRSWTCLSEMPDVDRDKATIGGVGGPRRSVPVAITGAVTPRPPDDWTRSPVAAGVSRATVSRVINDVPTRRPADARDGRAGDRRRPATCPTSPPARWSPGAPTRSPWSSPSRRNTASTRRRSSTGSSPTPTSAGSPPGAQDVLRPHGIHLVIIPTDPPAHHHVLRYLRQGHVDGVLLICSHAADPLPRQLADLGIPAVLSARPGRPVAAQLRRRRPARRRPAGRRPPRSPAAAAGSPPSAGRRTCRPGRTG